MILSIDPGVKGAIAWLRYDGSLHSVEDLPIVDKSLNPSLLHNMIAHGPAVAHAVVERQQYMPPIVQGRQQGGASTFKTGLGYGIILGILASLECPIVILSPTQWKKPLGLTKDKERSRKLAIETWPHQADRFKFKKNEGRAEAGLLGYAFIRSLHGKAPVPPDQGEPALTKPALTPARRVVRRATHTSVSPDP